jgi:hypothetical protein
MEATMRVLSIKELMRLTRVELTDLLVRITNALPDMMVWTASAVAESNAPKRD